MVCGRSPGSVSELLNRIAFLSLRKSQNILLLLTWFLPSSSVRCLFIVACILWWKRVEAGIVHVVAVIILDSSQV